MEQSLNEELNSMMRSVSRNIGEYDLSPDPIHIGNNGQIFTMKNRVDSRLHVLKVFWKRGPNPNTEAKGSDKAYSNEKRIHEALKNRYIVQLYNTFQDETNSYMVLQHCQGGNLRKIMKSPIGVQVVRDYGLQIAKGLAYLHKKEIIHRDLRPENILLTADSQIKICDFGMAVKCAQGEEVREYRGGFGYLPPQAIELHNEKFDIWSLGCILYEMVVGSLPFKCNNWKELNLINQDYLKKYSFDCKLPPALLHLFKRIFVYDKNKRISIEEVLVHPFFTNQPLPLSPQKSVQKGISKKSSSKTLFKSLELRESKHENKQNVNKQNLPLKSTAPDYKKLILDKKNQKEGRSELKIQLTKNGTPCSSRPTSGDKSVHGSKLDQFSTLRDKESKSNLPINYDVRNKAYQPKRAQMSPLKTNGMIIKPIAIKKNIIRIDEEGLTRQDEKLQNNWIKVSSDGRTIRICKQDQEKKYALEQLPQKYYKTYEECKKIVLQIQSQTPRIAFSIQNIEMRIMFDGKIHVKLNQQSTKILQQADLLSNRRSLPQRDFLRLRKLYTSLCALSRQSE